MAEVNDNGSIQLFEDQKIRTAWDAEKEEYIYESFSEIFKDQYNNEKEVCWLKKDTVSEIYECIDESVQNMISVVSKNNLLCYVVDTSKFEHINEMSRFLSDLQKKLISSI
jgi:hypothetical protein